jgi:hypothetical protein
MKNKNIMKIVALIFALLFIVNIGIGLFPSSVRNFGNSVLANEITVKDKRTEGRLCDEIGLCEFYCEDYPGQTCFPMECHYHGGDCEVVE